MLKMKKENLIIVAGIVWLLAGVNVAVIGVRALYGMNGASVAVLVGVLVGADAIFFAFHAMFRELVRRALGGLVDSRKKVYTSFDS